MRILADENFPRLVVEALRERGHDVFWARTGSPGASDTAVLARAQAEGRLVVTFDKDFGELAFHRGQPAACGVILFRIRMRSAEGAVRTVVAAIEGRTDWAGHFTVVEAGRVRMRPLPPRA